MNDRVKRALGPSPECPSIEWLGQFADGTIEQQERQGMEAHVSRCAHCQSELALLKEFEAATIAPQEKPAVDWITARLKRQAPEIFGSARPLPWWQAIFKGPSLNRAAFVLGALLLVAGATLFIRHNSAPPVIPGTDTGQETLRSNSVLPIAPIGDLQETPTELRWQPLAGASRYEVHVMEVDRNDLWTAQTSDTRIELPIAVKAKIAPAKSLVWTVGAFDAAGKRITASSEETFRLAPSAAK